MSQKNEKTLRRFAARQRELGVFVHVSSLRDRLGELAHRDRARVLERLRHPERGAEVALSRGRAFDLRRHAVTLERLREMRERALKIATEDIAHRRAMGEYHSVPKP